LSSNDSDLAADAKTDAAKADVANSDAAPTITVAAGSTVTMDTNAGTPGGETPGDSLDGNGQQGQSDGDQAQDQQQASDPSSGNVAATEGLGAIMAMLAAPVQQPASPTAGATAATLPAIGTSLPATPTQAGGVSTDPADLTASQVATAAAVTTTSQPTVNAGVTLAVPGPATTATQQSAASNLPAPGINLPTTAGVASALPADTPDATADFANIVASKIDKSTTGTENLRISATSAAPDKAAQLPRPLVRIDENRTPQPTVQPAVTTPPTTPVAAAPAEVTPASPPASTDYSSDGLRGFGSFSSLLPAGGALAASKQPDMIAALRQQLANASIQEQVAVHIQRAVKDSADKISIQLSPEELGRIHVKMNVDDDKQVSASITVERPATLELLQRDTKALERALQEAGLKADSGSLSFSLQRGNQGDSSDTPGWGQNGGRQIGLSGQDKSAGTVETSSTSPGNEVDTANGLVDVAV
jgi:flagellar hook-length control protein FliK